eukprot:GHUV01016146.1.p1 GENE.GHUV01016146.1~~GHUV01016146.1.p1  ORF type:complete len:169 (+),score=6.43 GHUV01016146.1:110-616(+)
MPNPGVFHKLQTGSLHYNCAFKPARVTKGGHRRLYSRCRAQADASTVEPDISEHSAPRVPLTPVEQPEHTLLSHRDSHSPSPAHGDTLLISPAAERELAEALLAENGFRSTRRTKIVCTLGPSSCSYEVLSALAEHGMNVARLNMTHGNHAWHQQVVDRIRTLNKEKG